MSWLVQQTQPIQYYHKFSCISSFTFISLSTVQTYSKVSQIHLSYKIPQSNLFQQSHILNSVTNSIVWSRFTFSSLSTVQTYSKVSQISLVLSNSTVISRSTDPTYSTLSQIQLYYLIPQSNLIQQFHIFKNVKIQLSYLVYILISFNSRTYSILSQIQLYI